MKKIFISFMMLLSTASMWSQSVGGAPGPATATGDYDPTYVIARLAFNGTLLMANDRVFANADYPQSGYSISEIGALAYLGEVDCTQRQTGSSFQISPILYPQTSEEAISDDAFYYYSIPVINTTNEDLKGEIIEIRLTIGNSIYGISTSCTYTGTTTTYGTLSDPVILNLVTPQITTSPISLNIDETVNAADLVTYPENMATVYNWDGQIVEPKIGGLDMMDEDLAYLVVNRKDNFTITGKAQTPEGSPVPMTLFVEGFSDYRLPFDVIVAPIPVEEISANAAKPFPTALCVGQEVALTDFVVFQPENATNKGITWESGNEDVVAINRSATDMGYYLAPVSPGTATITATSNDNPEATISWDVTVYSALERISFEHASVYISVGEQYSFPNSNLINFSPDASKLYDLHASYTVNPEGYEEYLSIDESGVITGLKPNDNLTVSITVEDGFGNSAGCRVPVVVRNLPTSITFDKPVQNTCAGESLNFDYTIEPVDASHFHISFDDNDENVFDLVRDETTGEITEIKVKDDVEPGTYKLKGQAYDSRYGTPIADVCDEITVNVYNELESVAPNTTEVIVVEKGGTIDLKDYVVTSPTDNLFDVKYSFTMVNEGDDEYVRISDDGILEGLNTNGYGVVVVAISAEDGFGNKASSEAWLLVSVHVGVTSLVVPEENVVMWVDEVKYLDELVTVLPEDANYQGLDYTITNLDEGSDEVIVQDEAPNEIGYGHLLAVNPGMARIDVVSEDNENVKGSFIIEVRRHVDGIVGPEDDITVEAFTKVLLDEYITVYPEDAYDKSVTWAVADTTKCIELTQENGSWYVTMKRTGSVPLTVTSNENSDISTMVFVNSTAAVTGIITTADKQILWTNGEPSAVPVSDLYDITPKYATNQDVTWEVEGDAIEVWDWSNEYSGAAVKARNVGEATLTLTTEDGGYTGTVDFEVRAHTEYIEMTTKTIEAKVGDIVSLDEVEYTVGPDEAYDKSVTWSVGENSVAGIVEIIENDGAWSFKALKEGEVSMKIATVDNPESAFAYITVFVKLYPTSLAFDEPEQTVYPGEQVNVCLSLLPEGVDPSWVDVEWTYDPDVFDFTGEGFMETTEAGGPGISVAADVPDVTVNPEAQSGEYTIYACIAIDGDFEPVPLTVTVPQLVTDISLSADSEDGDIYMEKDNEIAIPIVVEPADADFDASSIEVVVDASQYQDLMPNAVYAYVKVDESGNPYIIVQASMTGDYPLSILYSYPGGEIESDPVTLHVGFALDLANGWNWISTPQANNLPSTNSFATEFSNSLVEVRSQRSAAFLDPVYGFFGSLSNMESNTAYKMNVDNADGLHYVFYNTQNDIFFKARPILLEKGWNWVANPYVNNYPLSHLQNYGLFGQLTESIFNTGEFLIMAPDGNFIVVDTDYGYLQGTMKNFYAGECYMVYSPEAGAVLEWPALGRLGSSWVANATPRRTDNYSNPFQYDIHQFADAMAVIATVDGLDVPDDCTIGAFVDGECRGMGCYSNGKFFIGVHGEKNDVVVFKAYDAKNDLWYDIDQSIQFTSMVGSTKEPVRLSTSTLTNVDNVLGVKSDNATYDVTGRRVNGPASNGVYIVGGKKTLVK